MWAIYLIPLIAMWVSCYFIGKRRAKLTKARSVITYILTGVYVCVVYYGTFAHFFFGTEGDKNKGTIKIQYLFPKRTKELQIGEISSISVVPSYKGNFQTIIKMKNGKKFEGAPTGRIEVEESVRSLNSLL